MAAQQPAQKVNGEEDGSGSLLPHRLESLASFQLQATLNDGSDGGPVCGVTIKTSKNYS